MLGGAQPVWVPTFLHLEFTMADCACCFPWAEIAWPQGGEGLGRWNLPIRNFPSGKSIPGRKVVGKEQSIEGEGDVGSDKGSFRNHQELHDKTRVSGNSWGYLCINFW